MYGIHLTYHLELRLGRVRSLCIALALHLRLGSLDFQCQQGAALGHGDPEQGRRNGRDTPYPQTAQRGTHVTHDVGIEGVGIA